LAKDITVEIDDLACKRQVAQAEGDAASVASLSNRIEALYEEKRRLAASHGSPKARERAMQRALAERELDRLMQA
jgi:hypothetical protein